MSNFSKNRSFHILYCSNKHNFENKMTVFLITLGQCVKHSGNPRNESKQKLFTQRLLYSKVVSHHHICFTEIQKWVGKKEALESEEGDAGGWKWGVISSTIFLLETGFMTKLMAGYK